MIVNIPNLYSIDITQESNTIRQVLKPSSSIDVEVIRESPSEWLVKDENNHEILIVNKKRSRNVSNLLFVQADEITEDILSSKNIEKIWIKHHLKREVIQPTPTLVQEINNSWKDKFHIQEENRNENIPGLRTPQIGGIYATLSHWSISSDIATIVMPTGTGKTETMLSLLVAYRIKKLLVVVPSQALRDQTERKFLDFGLLKKIGIVKEGANYPIVGKLSKRFKTENELKAFFEQCNVVITTMQLVSGFNLEFQKCIAKECTHLFIDEAHHIGAPSWNNFKAQFKESTILQFTATPFRNDEILVDGKVIFNYPLKKAQEEGYYKPIKFIPIYEYLEEKSDLAIALKAVDQLRTDISNGFNHKLMARVASIKRAEEVYKIYEDNFAEFNPVLIHSKLKNINALKDSILHDDIRIIVCVDMLGEGFDLPQLKIAAFHDIKQSIPITLQLVGRFTRSSAPNLGDASFIVNCGLKTISDKVELLYAYDADWNALLPHISNEHNEKQMNLWEFINGFEIFPSEFSLQNIRPALSAVVYKCPEFYPLKFEKSLPNSDNYEHITIDYNPHKNTIISVIGRKNNIQWGNVKEIYEIEWVLYIIYWDSEQKLLFINSSVNAGVYKDLAEKLSNNTSQILEGDNIYRSFANVKRLRLQNLGLKDNFSKLANFTMTTGQDIVPTLPIARRQNKTKTNTYGTGFVDGMETSVGCSCKGRVWARKTGNIDEFRQWCRDIGRNLLNEDYNPDEILEGTLKSIGLNERPPVFPFTVDWPLDLYQRTEQQVLLKIPNVLESTSIAHFDIDIINPSKGNPLQLKVCYEDNFSIYNLIFEGKNNNYYFERASQLEKPFYIEYGSNSLLLEEYFSNNPPTFFFVDGSSLEGSLYTMPPSSRNLNYSINNIITIDWEGVDIKSESKGIGNRISRNSIQFHMIELLKASDDYSLIFNDDGSGEIADIVLVKEDLSVIKIDLYHLKYSSGDTPGARIQDLYEVCGQAQKSIKWKRRKSYEIFNHILLRGAMKPIRYEKGDSETVRKLLEMSKQIPIEYTIHIVQPGISKNKIKENQDISELLSVTDSYLMDTYMIPLKVITSE